MVSWVFVLLVCVCVMLCACLGGCVYDCELGRTPEDFYVHFVVLVFGVWHVVGLLLDLRVDSFDVFECACVFAFECACEFACWHLPVMRPLRLCVCVCGACVV